MESSDKTWSTGGGNGKLLWYPCHENPINGMKRQTYVTPENEPPGWKVSNMLLGKSAGQLPVAPKRMKWLGQSRNDTQLWMWLVVKVTSNAIKNNITRNLKR